MATNERQAPSQARRLARVLALVLAPVIAACDAGPMAARPSEAAASQPVIADVAKLGEFREFSLTIYGYNYTDTGIGLFQVNGHGGGNLSVSHLSSIPGGSSVCCVPLFTPLPKGNKVKIKWNRYANVWCEQEVPFEGPVPSNGEHMEVHFYPDGHIELAVTPDFSPPRLALDRSHENSRHTDPSQNVNNDSKFSRCKDGYH